MSVTVPRKLAIAPPLPPSPPFGPAKPPAPPLPPVLVRKPDAVAAGAPLPARAHVVVVHVDALEVQGLTSADVHLDELDDAEITFA